MKTAFYILAVVLIVANSDSTVRGQVKGTQAGSAAAQKKIQDYKDTMAEQTAAIKKATDTGRDLFGSDEKRKGKEFAGTISNKHAPDFKVNDWGRVTDTLRTVSKVSNTEYVVMSLYKGSEVLLLRGLDMQKVRDGVQFVLPRPVVVSGTFTYTTAGGAERTVLVIEYDTAKLDELAGKPAEVANKPQAKSDAKGKDNNKATDTQALRDRVIATSAVGVYMLKKEGYNEGEIEYVATVVNHGAASALPLIKKNNLDAKKMEAVLKLEEIVAWIDAEKTYTKK